MTSPAYPDPKAVEEAIQGRIGVTCVTLKSPFARSGVATPAPFPTAFGAFVYDHDENGSYDQKQRKGQSPRFGIGRSGQQPYARERAEIGGDSRPSLPSDRDARAQTVTFRAKPGVVTHEQVQHRISPSKISLRLDIERDRDSNCGQTPCDGESQRQMFFGNQ